RPGADGVLDQRVQRRRAARRARISGREEPAPGAGVLRAAAAAHRPARLLAGRDRARPAARQRRQAGALAAADAARRPAPGVDADRVRRAYSLRAVLGVPLVAAAAHLRLRLA